MRRREGSSRRREKRWRGRNSLLWRRVRTRKARCRRTIMRSFDFACFIVGIDVILYYKLFKSKKHKLN
jgi:hypothetical protein